MTPTWLTTLVTRLVRTVAVGSAILILLGWVNHLGRWATSGPLQFVTIHASTFLFTFLATIVLLGYFLLLKLRKRLIVGFHEKFKGDLRKNWDFDGEWRIVENNTLQITNSDPGGLTKIGALWENYTLSFQAKILNGCIGVIIRAQDLKNYYMFQINSDRIRPHRRATVPVLDPIKGKNEEDKLRPVSFAEGWQIYDDPGIPVSNPLKDWFKVKVSVKGESVVLYINNQLVLQKETFIKIPVGKIGFRNSGQETALVRDVKVTLDY